MRKMKIHRAVLLLLLPALCLPASAQYFEFDPGQTVSMVLPMEITQEGIINVWNITADSLNIEWRKVGNSCPEEEWHMEFCDEGHCWDFLPNGAVMFPVASGDNGYLRLIVNAQNVSGSGSVDYWVFREGHMEEFIECFFLITTEDLVSTGEHVATTSTAWWNPQAAALSLVSSASGVCTVHAITGELVGTYPVNENHNLISLDGLAPGIYVVRMGQMPSIKIFVP